MVSANSTPHASDGNGAANQAGSFSLPMKPTLSFPDQLGVMENRGLIGRHKVFVGLKRGRASLTFELS